MTRRIDAASLRARLTRPEGELALLDVREEGIFARGHLLTASSMPLSRLELRIDALVPRRSTPIVVCDGGEGLAERAAERLETFGYGDVSILDGGIEAMAAEGSVLFEGIYVPSKAFGEFVEHRYDTPRITAAELARLRESDTDMVILDSRPLREYRRMTIPGGVSVPGAELVHRVHDIAPSPDTLVVVNCAGRTRSIIGAQSLINAGTPNRVVALENGTMGWNLAGFQCEHGQERRPPAMTEEGKAWAREAARRVAARFDVREVDAATLERWRGETDRRTLYVFDVRLPDEYEAGHRPGSRNAQGGQLVQATDSYVGTRGARIVLIDDDGVRATMTASWLIQMGWTDVHVLDEGLGRGPLETGPEPVAVRGLDGKQPATVSVDELAAMRAAGETTVIDLGTSREHKSKHIPGAWFTIRSRFAGSLPRLDIAGTLVLTSPDGWLAKVAAAEAAACVRAPVKVLEGGTAAWQAAGQPVESGLERMLDARDDIYLLPYEHESEVEKAMKAYLSWETALVPQVEEDGSATFRFFAPGEPRTA